MISELFRKWFGLTTPSCQSCEILRDQLEESNRERRELLHRLLDRDKTEPLPSTPAEPPVPITPQFIPWRVKQQMLEAEDRRAAELMRQRSKELAASKNAQSIDALEKELGVSDASQIG